MDFEIRAGRYAFQVLSTFPIEFQIAPPVDEAIFVLPQWIFVSVASKAQLSLSHPFFFFQPLPISTSEAEAGNLPELCTWLLPPGWGMNE